MYLRVSLTDRCNLRCTYCLPERARFAPEAASSREMRRLTNLVVEEAKVHKIRLTGGEPTLCDDLVDHVRAAKALVPTVGLTSNGIMLEPLLPQLRDAGLDLVNISLDGLTDDDFHAVTRRSGLSKVLASIAKAKALGFPKVKVNVVARRGVDFAGFVRFAAFEGIHLRFIELMAIGEAQAFHGNSYVSAHSIRQELFEKGISLIEDQERDEPTSRVWTVPGHAADEVSVGFITTSSHPFCDTCDRLRLTSQGNLHTCLFDESGTPLLDELRRDHEDEVRARIRQAVATKAPPSHFVRQGVMAGIGG